MKLIKYSLLSLFFLIGHLYASCPCGLDDAGDTAFANLAAAVAFSPDNNCLAVANTNPVTGDSQVTVYKVDGCNLNCLASYSLGTTADPMSIEYSPTDNLLAVLTTGNLSTFPVNSDCTLGSRTNYPITNGADLSFSFDGQCLAVTTSAVSSSIILYSVTGCTLVQNSTTLSGTFPGFTSVSFSPVSNCLAVLDLIDANGGAVVHTYTVTDCEVLIPNTTRAVGQLPSSVKFSTDGNCLVVSNEQNVYLNVFGVIDCSLDAGTTFNLDALITGYTDVAFSGNCLAVSGADDDTIRILTISGACALTLDQTFALTPGTNPESIAYSPDGRLLAVAQPGTNNARIVRTNVMDAPIISQIDATCDGCISVSGNAFYPCSGPTGNAGLTVTLEEGGTPLNSTVTDDSGNFSLTGCFIGGQHNLSIIAQNPVGCTGAKGLAVAFSDNF